MLRTGFAVALLALAAGACRSSTDLQLDRSMPLPLDARVAVAGAQVSVRFAGVAGDSRCPSGAMCIWAGDAVAQVDVLAPGDSVRAALHTNPGAGPTRTTFRDYTVELVDLQPYPEVGKTIDPGSYVATLRVTRK